MALDAGSLVFQVFAKDDPLGTALATLSNAYDKTVTVEDNGIGGGSFRIHPDDAGASYCTQDNYVAAWRDTVSGDPIAGFWIDQVETVVLSPDEGGGEEVRVSGRGPIAVLEEAIVWHKNKLFGDGVVYPAKHQWRWTNAHPMTALNRLLTEAKTGRGCFPFVTWDFTGTTDSDGSPYSSEYFDEWSFEMGTDLLTVVRELREAGLHISMDAGLVLHAWDSYDNDLSGSISFAAGTDIRDTSEIEAAARRGKSAVLVMGEDRNDADIFRAVVNSTYETALGRRKEAFWRYNRTATKTILKNVGQRKLRRWKKHYDGPFTLGVIDTTSKVALVDYTVGDTVGVPTAFVAAGKDRIASITLAETDNGEYDPTLEFGDLAPDPVTGNIPSGDIGGLGCCGSGTGVGRGPSGGGGGSSSGSGANTPGSGTSAQSYLLDDFARSNAVAEGAGGLVTTASASATSHDIDLPAGAGVSGRLLWVWLSIEYASTIATQMDAQMAAAGFSPASEFTSSNIAGGRVSRIYSKITAGTDGSSFSITLSAARTVLAVSGIAENASSIEAEEALLTAGTYLADPPSLTPTWESGDSALWYTIGFSTAALSGDPSGYSNAVAGLTDGTTSVRVSSKTDDSATEDPSAYTGGGTITDAGGAFTFAIADPSVITSALTTSSGTSHEIALPDGLQTGDGLLAIVAYTRETAETLYNEVITPDWPDSAYGQGDGGGSAGQEQIWLWKQLDGTEGFTGADDTFTIDHDVATSNLYAITIRIPRIAMLPTEGFPWNAISSWGETPGGTPTWDTWDVTTGYSEWLTTDPCIRFVILSGTGTISGLPTGYTVLTEVDNGSLYFAVAYKDDVSTDGDTPSPDPTLGTGHHVISSFGVRTTGSETGWGSIPEGYGVDTEAPWLGGNTWATSGTGATFTLSSGSGVITLLGDDRTAVAILESDAPDDENDEPWGPWAGGRAEFLFLWKVNPQGDTADTDPNRLTIAVYDGQSRNKLNINLGDDVSWSYMDPDNQRGIALSTGTSTYSDFVAKTIASDTLYYTRLDFRGDTLKAKLWAASATEPAAWDVTLARELETGLPDIGELRIDFDGNDGMVLSIAQIDAALGAIAGSSVGRHVIGYGDGSTTTFSLGQSFVAGSLLVWVDNQPVIPSSVDGTAGTFTLPSAPYGDPVEGINGSAVIEASWEAA